MESVTFNRWTVVYPVYINSKKTLAEGRRVGASTACENPTHQEIADVCKYLNLPHEVESDKCYSRDYTQRGRVRISMKDDNGNTLHQDIQNKSQLLKKLGQLIPKLQSRQKSSASQGSSSSAAGAGKKKGKGRKR